MSSKQVFNLLTTKSDWYLISLYHITPESNIGAVHGLYITDLKSSWLLDKFSMSVS